MQRSISAIFPFGNCFNNLLFFIGFDNRASQQDYKIAVAFTNRLQIHAYPHILFPADLFQWQDQSVTLAYLPAKRGLGIINFTDLN